MSVIIICGSQVMKDTVASIYYLSHLLLPLGLLCVCIMRSTGDDDYFWKREKMILQFGNCFASNQFNIPPDTFSEFGGGTVPMRAVFRVEY